MAWKKVKVESEDGVAVLTINSPPINIMTGELLIEICWLTCSVGSVVESRIDQTCPSDTAGKMMLADPDVRVIVFRSAIPGYFMPHYVGLSLAKAHFHKSQTRSKTTERRRDRPRNGRTLSHHRRRRQHSHGPFGRVQDRKQSNYRRY